jgi:hypothetical protein
MLRIPAAEEQNQWAAIPGSTSFCFTHGGLEMDRPHWLPPTVPAPGEERFRYYYQRLLTEFGIGEEGEREAEDELGEERIEDEEEEEDEEDEEEEEEHVEEEEEEDENYDEEDGEMEETAEDDSEEEDEEEYYARLAKRRWRD